MQYRQIFLCLSLGLLLCLSSDPSLAATDAEAHYRLDETTGTVATDASGNGNHGTYVNGPTLGVAGIRGNAAELNMSDTDDRVDLPNTVLDGAMDASFAFWIKTTNTGNAGVLAGANAAQANAFLVFFLDSTNLRFSKEANTVNVTIPTVSDNEWHHFVWTWDGDTNTAILYRNGQLVSSQVVGGPLGVPIDIDSGGLLLGQEQDCVGGCFNSSQVVSGSLDDVQIYRRVISAAEVAELYGLVVHWKLDETIGNTAVDSSGLGNDGFYEDEPPKGQQDAPYGTAVYFQGNLPSVILAGNSTLNAMESFTAAAWAKSDTGTWNADNYLLSKEDGKFSLYGTGGSKLINIQITTTLGSSSASFDLSTISNFNLRNWHHYAASYDAIEGVLRLYVDGALVTSQPITSSPLASGSMSLMINGQYTEMLTMLDDVRLYNRRLTDLQIAELFGLVGHWEMDEGAGTTAADSTAFSNDATLAGATWTTDCAGKNALAFDGTNDTATTNAPFTPPANGTVAFWMQASGTPAVRERIFGVNGNWEARLETTGKISFDLGASPYVGNEPFATEVVDSVDRWYHIVAMFNDTDDSYAVYVNGELQASGTSPVNLVSQSPGILTFGTRTGSGENWKGSLQDFRVYNRWLAPSEISQLSGLAGYWKLDETSGTVAIDASPNGNNGTYTGGPLLDQPGTIGRAVNFDGANDYVNIVDNPSLRMDDTFSLSAWVRAEDFSGLRRMVLLKEGEYGLAIFPNGEINWAVANTVPGWVWHPTGAFVATNQWKHIVVTYDNATVKTYANGVLVETFIGSGTVGDFFPSDNRLQIGGRLQSSPNLNFDGRIDDVRVLSRVMCPEEVKDLYNGGVYPGVRIIRWVEVR